MRKFVVNDIKGIPGCIFSRLPLPLNQDLNNGTTPQLLGPLLQNCNWFRLKYTSWILGRKRTEWSTLSPQFLSQTRNMEHRMNRTVLWQSHLVSLLTNTLNNLKWTKESWRKLIMPFHSRRRLSIRLELNVNPITNTKGHIRPVLISQKLHPSLSRS